MRSATSRPPPAGRAAKSIGARSLSAKVRMATMAQRSDRAPRPERVAAFRTGLSAESRAAAYLIAKGYRIVARRFRSGVGEIDIIARRRGTIVFVEVKARSSLDEAAYAVTPQQQARIIAAAEAW